MPGIIAALADSGTPFSILTKGTLLRRDLPLLARRPQHVPVDLAMSIAVYDDDLQQSVEPGTPTTAARLATVTAAPTRGSDCSVFMMPSCRASPTTSTTCDRALAACASPGRRASVLGPPPQARCQGVVSAWLEREHPELVTRYRDMYATSTYAPLGYRKWLAARMRPLLREHGLEHGTADPATGSIRSSALDDAAAARGTLGFGADGRPRSLIAHELPGGARSLSRVSSDRGSARVPPSPGSGHSRPGGSARPEVGDPR